MGMITRPDAQRDSLVWRMSPQDAFSRWGDAFTDLRRELNVARQDA